MPLGEPGVFSARLVRTNPETLYRDPTAGLRAQRGLAAEEALALAEGSRALKPGTLIARYRAGTLPASSLADAGGRDVDMAKRFNLAQMEVVCSGGFTGMDPQRDLPTGPVREPASADSAAPYVYNWSIPAARHVADADNDLYPGEQSEPFIYGAIGRTMTVRAGFRDVLGYATSWQPPVEAELKGLYFDPLIPLTALTGLQVWHEVDGRTGHLRLRMRFDPTAVVDGQNPVWPLATRPTRWTAGRVPNEPRRLHPRGLQPRHAAGARRANGLPHRINAGL